MNQIDNFPVRHEAMRIAGEKVVTEDRIDVVSPYSGALVGTIPKGQVEDVRRAFKVAANYQSKLTRHERYEILQKTADILVARKDEISDIITAEAGLCKKDSLYEVGRAYDVFSLSARICTQDDGEIFSCDITPHGKKRKIFTVREPLRAISAITPFNHPLNQVAHKVAPSIATNNCMVLKPTEKTPLTALKLADILYEAGLPPEMFQVVTGAPQDIADEMLVNEDVDLVTFTGGVPIGKYIAEKAGYKRKILELGGNDPLIVLADADLEKAADLAVAGSFKNSGQRCTAVKRIIVLDEIADAFSALVVEKTKKLRYGNPMDPDNDMGTVINEQSAILFQDRVNDAVAKGAKLLYGNERNGALYSPTVVDHVPFDCELVREETFGPVAPIIRCKSVDEIIEVSNSTAFGLSSGVCTDHWPTIQRFIRELNVGTVNIWEVPGYRIEMSPFGGIKDSGLGYKEGVLEAMKSFTNLKTYSLPWE
ncbi:phosphonoacetaldehyde dehydrogenase [Terasakiella pusilla]|jgi:putative phosphonoacetaldehyde dehydrogenase|uniref:phosphonoacetaldehyde dehydrogenase n=1 Tax=Terasakiella pusilla TaxID=64973 RepID=UPI00048E5D43|nr:phosphonoacetaldehyde dehydrogenase [Terasakiella pusilla]